MLGFPSLIHSVRSAALLLGCLVIYTGHVRADESADLDSLPAAVQKTARAQVGSSKVEEVEGTFEEGQHATEVEYRENGQKMAVVIAADGTVIQKEHRMSPGEAPAAIKAAVASQFPDGRITHIEGIDRKSVFFYEISVKAGGKSHELKLDGSGKPLK